MLFKIFGFLDFKHLKTNFLERFMSLWALLGSLGGHFESPWTYLEAFLGRLVPLWSVSWGVLERLLGRLGASWAPLGAFLWHLGRLWGRLRAHKMNCLMDFGASSSRKSVRNHRENCFLC